MKKTGFFALLAASAILSACATVDQPEGKDGAATASASRLEANTLTGSRIPTKKSEKMVSGMDGQEYGREMRNQASPFESK